MGHFIGRKPMSTRHAHVHLSGRIEGNGSSDPTVFDDKGDFITATRDSAGTYTITAKETWPKIIGYSLPVLGANQLVAHITAEAINTTGALTVEIRDLAGTLTDLTSSDLLFMGVEVTNSATVG